MKIHKDVPLAPLTTFQLGGKAKFFASITTQKNLRQALDFAITNQLPIFVLGSGSDILIDDAGLNALVIKLANHTLNTKKVDNKIHLTASAGIEWDDLVAYSVSQNLQGIECLSAIPGTVGASPVQNIGAYGQEIKDTLVSLKAYDLELNRFIKFTNSDCHFSYRDSVFKSPKNKGRYIIWEVTFALLSNHKPTITYESLKSFFDIQKITSPTLSQVRDAVISIRQSKLDDPTILPNAGSFFKNPIIDQATFSLIQKQTPDIPHISTPEGHIKLFAGWLIENTGFKGRTYKQVAVSPRNALVLTNPNKKGTTKQVLDLANQITAAVKQKFHLTLEPEVQYINL